MSGRLIMLGVAALVGAASLEAQQRGTVELGAFGSATSFDNHLGLNSGTGGGLRIGAFLDPRWSLEFDGSSLRAERPAAASTGGVTSLAARVALIPFTSGRLSWILGAGAVHTDYGFLSSYSTSGLVGAKVALGPAVALRVDGIADYSRRNTNLGMRVGVSLFRQPFGRVERVTVMVQGPPATVVSVRDDSVSATEQRRLRLIAANYGALRDSLAMPVVQQAVASSSVAALATMHEMIHFKTDGASLTDSAKLILDEKIAIFRANPSMRIVVVGNTDDRAPGSYNLALGSRRADAAKAYLVSRGIDPIRIEIATVGETNPIASGETRVALAQNRRAEFRLLVASDYLVSPKE